MTKVVGLPIRSTELDDIHRYVLTAIEFPTCSNGCQERTITTEYAPRLIATIRERERDLAIERGSVHTLRLMVDRSCEVLRDALEFTKSHVIGTEGWYAERDEVRAKIEDALGVVGTPKEDG